MNRCKKYIGKHWLGCWAILSIVYAGIIQLLFSFPAPNKFFVAHWEAGDILTYASTVSLGLLAMWQNKKMQEENDAAQEKLEDIILRSNELNIISKIIEHEERRIQQMQEKMNAYMQLCDPQAIGLALRDDDKIVYLTNIAELEKKIDRLFFEISSLLKEDKAGATDDYVNLTRIFGEQYLKTKSYITGIKNDEVNIYDKQVVEKMAVDLAQGRDAFMTYKEKYMEEQVKKLRRLLFENLSIKEVREIYG